MLSVFVAALLIVSFVPNSGCTKTKTITDTVTVTKNDTTTLTDTVKVYHDTTYRHINDSLWAYYKFDGNLADSSGNNHALTLVSGVALGYDMWGNANNALDFSGAAGGYAEIADGTSFNPTAFTISLFIEYRQSGGYGITKTDWNTAEGTSFSLGMDPTYWLDTLRFSLGTTPNNCSTPQATGVLAKNPETTHIWSWYHLVGTFNNGIGKLYVNGQYKATVTTPYTAMGWCSNAPFILGNWWKLGDVTPSFNGKMDEIRIYDRELSATEVTWLYNHFTTK